MSNTTTVWTPRASGQSANLATVMNARVAGFRSHYTERDAMLYALSVGFGRSLDKERELPFVVEHDCLRTVPTLATVVSTPKLLRGVGLDLSRVVHAEQQLTFAAPLPPAAQLLTDTEVVRVVDKGERKGCYITERSTVRDALSQAVLFTSTSTILARGDGGIGSAGGPPPEPHEIPDRAPDHVVRLQTRPDQSLWYRLNGDRNPLHTDPRAAARLGFPAPILHGLCTYGIACRSLLVAVCGYNPARLRTFGGRFTQPVLIGDEIETQIWLNDDLVSFRCRVPDRDVTVIDRGRAELSH